jgi:glycosyltransferase involved in cell wall biosynthesis
MKPKVLVVVAVDVTAWVYLRIWLKALQTDGCEVHVACSYGNYRENLASEGFTLHEIPFRRVFNPFAHIRPLLMLYRLMRQIPFDAVNTHTPVAAAVGRLAAWAARVPVRVNTVHGFYFHDRMARLPRAVCLALEWLLGQITTFSLFVSEEDRLTSLRYRIARNDGMTIYNGINLDRFRPPRDTEREQEKTGLGIDPQRLVIGITARIVREKGYFEFVAMAEEITALGHDVFFLVVGDTLPSDRGRVGEDIRKRVRRSGMESRFRFVGFTNEVARLLRAMDIFVLPTYREGFPVSVLEAMGTGLPVVTTDIRGCREAVVHGTTGLLVPPGNVHCLTVALQQLLKDPTLMSKMGAAGRARVVESFDEKQIAKRFVEGIRKAMRQVGPCAIRRTEREPDHWPVSSQPDERQSNGGTKAVHPRV